MATAFHRSVFVAALIGLGSCRGSEDVGSGGGMADPPPQLPAIVAVNQALDPADAPFRESATFALTRLGTITYRQVGDQGTQFITIDSNGQRIARWGRRGAGPGESRTGWLVSGDSVVTVVSTDPPAVQVFDPGGRLLHDLRDQPVDGFAQPMVGDSIDRSFGQRLVGQTHVLEDISGPIVRSCVFSKCSRVILPANDSILRLVQLSTPRRDGMRWPPYASEPGRFVLGDGVAYKLWMFDDAGRLSFAFGRTLLARRLTSSEIGTDEAKWEAQRLRGASIDLKAMREFALKEPLPHFGYAGLGFDGEHHLWVMGKSNDSTFLDVFQDSVFLGRHMVSCQRQQGTMAVRGHWLAIMCQDPSDTLTPFRVRLFRIEKPPRR